MNTILPVLIEARKGEDEFQKYIGRMINVGYKIDYIDFKLLVVILRDRDRFIYIYTKLDGNSVSEFTIMQDAGMVKGAKL